MTHDELTRQRLRQAAWRIRLAFAASVLGSATFAGAYTVGGQVQVEAAGLAVAFGGIGYGLSVWASRLLPSGGYVEEHEGFSSTPEAQELLVDSLEASPSPLSRKGLLLTLGGALGAIGAATLFPLRSMLAPRAPHPVHALRHTVWGAGGLRLVDPDGRPIRPADVSAATIMIVHPQGHPRTGDAAAFLVRLDPRVMTSPPPGGDIGGVVAYSLLCTHAGCAVTLYEQGAARLLCPCHQSVFDLAAAAKPIAGPAARPLPGLPIAVDDEGYLIATADFTTPPGPGFWSFP